MRKSQKLENLGIYVSFPGEQSIKYFFLQNFVCLHLNLLRPKFRGWVFTSAYYNIHKAFHFQTYPDFICVKGHSSAGPILLCPNPEEHSMDSFLYLKVFELDMTPVGAKNFLRWRSHFYSSIRMVPMILLIKKEDVLCAFVIIS